MSQVFSFPFIQPWMSEAADPAATEPPTLRLVRNGRFRRLGRVSKRTGLIGANTAVSSTSTALSGRPMLLGDFNGRQILIQGDGILQARSADFYSWTTQDRVPTFVPERAQEIARDDVDGPPASPSVAASGTGYVLVAYNNANDTIVNLYDDQGTKLWSRTIPGEFEPKALAVFPGISSSFVLFTRSGTTINARSFDASTLTLSGATGHGPLNASTDNWDANVYSSTRIALTYRDAAATARVELINSSTLALVSSAGFAINNAQIMPAVFGVSPENIYVAWWDPTATRSVKARVYDSALVLTSGGTVTLGDSVGFAVKPVIGRRDATSAHILWGGNSSATDPVMRHRTLTNAGVLGANTSEIRNVHVISEPFETDTNKIRLWVRQAGTTVILARYLLLTLRLESFGTFEAQPELHTDTGWVAQVSTFENLPSAQTARLGNGEYVCAVLRRIRGNPGTTNNVGVVLLRYRGANTAREAQRQGIEAQRVYHVTGGQLIEHMGSAADESLNADLVTGIENNFLAPPFITAGTVAAGGSLTPESAPAAQDSVYQYCCTFEALDSAGRRTRSLPSNIVTVFPTAANRTGSLVVSTCGVSGRRLKDSAQPVSVTVYRTESNGAIFYRVSSDVAAPNAFANAATQTITDGEADTIIRSRETIYTPTREAGNYPCPSHRFGVQGGNRMFVAGLWDPTLVACSKPFVPDEPVQFVEDNAFRILAPAPVTGLGWLDGSLVIFCERSIYVASGDGPDRQGSGAYLRPQRLPADIGCTDWRTVREVPQGLLFQGSRGFYLLPRGFGAPVFQADIQEQLLSYSVCLGAGRHDERRYGESSLVYLMGGSDAPLADELVGLVYDLESGKWVSVDTYASAYTLAGTWQGLLAVSSDDLADLAFAAGAGSGDTDSNYTETHVKTGQIHPFGFGGFGRVQEILVHGEYRALAYLGIRLVIDGVASTAVQLSPSSATRCLGVNGTTLSTGEKWFFRWRPPKCQGNTFEVEVWDARDDALGSNAEGISFNGISMLVDPEEGSKPLGSGNRG
jgi:hypothetical protein